MLGFRSLGHLVFYRVSRDLWGGFKRPLRFVAALYVWRFVGKQRRAASNFFSAVCAFRSPRNLPCGAGVRAQVLIQLEP